MKPSVKKVAIALSILLIVFIAAGIFLVDTETRHVAAYYAWKTFSRDSGSGRHADVNGVRLYYEVHGAGEPLLLLHGGTAFIESFYRQIPALARQFMVIAPDSRGHGRSQDAGISLRYDLMASDMARLLDKLGIPSAYIVGWSDGGIIGIDLAIRRPRLVKKLVTIGANVRVDGLTAEALESIRTLGPESPMLAEVRQFYTFIAPRPEYWPVLVGRVRKMWLSQPNYSALELSRIQAPVLVIAGERDDIRREHTIEIARSIPGARYEIVAGATHQVPIEKSDLVNSEIIRFLKGDAEGPR